MIQIKNIDVGNVFWEDQFLFSAGEPQINVSHMPTDIRRIQLRLNHYTPHDLVTLLLVTDALRRYQQKLEWLELYVPYLPFSRQDRVCNNGEALSVKVFADLINSQNYDKVITLDAHSDVGPALINRCKNIDMDTVISESDLGLPLGASAAVTTLVCPDAGAEKKVHKVAKRFEMPVLHARKVRDTATGVITDTVLDTPGDLDPKRRYLVLDDICDGGRTFIELHKVLKAHGAEHINLWVTHGIFSKGLSALSMFNTVWTTDSFPAPNDASVTAAPRLFRSRYEP